jgi:hypothetical protein
MHMQDANNIFRFSSGELKLRIILHLKYDRVTITVPIKERLDNPNNMLDNLCI